MNQLPVKLSPLEAEQNPEFVKLLTSMSSHVTKEGTSSLLQADLDEAKALVKQERHRWLEKHVLYSELQELLLDHQIKAIQSSPSSQSQFYKAVGELLTMTEIGDYLECHPDPSCDLTLLGLRREVIDQRNPHKHNIQSIQQKLIPDLEARLRKKCETLVDFHDSCTSHHDKAGASGGSSQLAFAKASQLPSVLESERSALETEQQALEQDKATRERQTLQYLQTVTDSLQTLERLITDHRLRSQPTSNRLMTDWMKARCDAMCLKIKILELQILCDTYYSDTVQTLTILRRHLDKAIADTEQELQQAAGALDVYRGVGMGFDSLVEEYTELRNAIDNKKWALREVQHLQVEENPFD